MDMVSTMTMPEVVIAGLLVLGVLLTALYVGGRIFGQRVADREHTDGASGRSRRRSRRPSRTSDHT